MGTQIRRMGLCRPSWVLLWAIEANASQICGKAIRIPTVFSFFPAQFCAIGRVGAGVKRADPGSACQIKPSAFIAACTPARAPTRARYTPRLASPLRSMPSIAGQLVTVNR